MTRERRMTILVAVLVVAIVYFVWTYGRALLPAGTVGRQGGSGGPRSVVGAEVVELDIARLERAAATYRPGRDLFRYAQARPPVRPPVERPVRPRPRPRPQPPPTEAKTPPKPQPPPVDVIYLGSFGPADNRIAVFADDEAIYNARVGDVVKEVFRLVAIGYESADLGFVDFPDAAAERLAVGDS